ncbi:SCP2 sterol-binding domain-containing protein [Amphritea sp. 2_MG-2023]|uniref:SCP2 sterol-binding domain-containing protein n=1 Tax=Amphritea TaxID=515417 RepID=UPI001C07B5E3|nr:MULTISPECIES: SCP2 sterol-binding domain-containing protein [Amphritea]MBU2963934.1 SCP2 sterol-binding domain-containing protein [Amphritea atlantica]MDO6419152.1 SCP2 sterol-binding domain-containing protein [Amphritea sp. 2_MG-2023]MDX2423172.1 SCP2 sterol-binding domain-containing protein [Amphritea sp.]
MSDIKGLFEQMVGRFDSAAATGLEAVFQYRLDEGDAYYAAISNGECTLGEGEHDEPSVTLLMDTETFKEVLDGETNGMQAFMAGRIRAEGDIMLATRLETLFPVS